MAGEISMITGIAVDALPSPVSAPATKAGSQRTGCQVESTAGPKTSAQPSIGGDIVSKSADQKELLERAQQALMAHNVTFSFERDPEDGRMYLHVIDKTTCEEIYRIPKNYLKNISPHLWQRHELDVHI